MDRIEEIMAECLERPSEEWSSAIDAACERQPELAQKLRVRYQALQAMGLQPPARSEPQYPSELGDFELHERLGGGGMGVVFRATERSLSREVALKLIRPENLYFERARERFQREVEAVARLQHPAIISIHTVGEELGLPFFTMELLGGRTIAEVLAAFASRSPMSLTGRDMLDALGGDAPRDTPELFRGTWVDACLGIATDVAEALEHAHGRGVLHRDIKPSNIMLLPDGRAVLLDFGLTSSAEADPARRVTRTGTAIGTLFYMSPEQALGKASTDARTDVYSLGVTLYEMLTLQVPFVGDTPMEIQARILAGQADPVRATNRRVPGDVATVCHTAMRSHVSERYPTAAAFAKDLQRARKRLPIEARPPGPVTRAVRWMQRNRGATVAGSALLLLVVGLPTGLLVQQRVHAAAITESFGKEKLAHSRTVDALAGERRALGESQEVLDFTVSLLLDLSPEKAAQDASARGLLDRGVERVPEMLDHHPRARARIQSMFGRVYFYWNDHEAGIAPLEAAIETWRGYEDDAARRQLLEALQTLGVIRTNLTDYEQAETLLLEALTLAEELAADEPDGGALATGHVLLAECYQAQNRLEEALPAARRGLELKRVGEASPGSIASTVGLVCTILQQFGRIDEAGIEMEAACRAFREAGSGDSLIFATFLDSYAFLRMGQERYAESAELYLESIEITSRLVGPDAAGVGIGMAHYGRLLSWTGDHAASVDAYQRSVEIARLHHPREHEIVILRELRLAQEFVRLERWDEARAAFADLEPHLRDVHGDENRLTGFCLEGLGRCLIEEGDLDGAEECLMEAYDIMDGVRSEAERRVAVRTSLARVHHGRGNDETARDYLDQALELGPWVIRRETTREALAFGAEFHTGAGRAAEAARCRKAMEQLEGAETAPR